MPTITWTDAPNGSAGHDGETLVCQLRKLGAGGWSARWCNGRKWDVSDQLSHVTAQPSKHFARRDQAKRAVQAAMN